MKHDNTGRQVEQKSINSLRQHLIGTHNIRLLKQIGFGLSSNVMMGQVINRLSQQYAVKILNFNPFKQQNPQVGIANISQSPITNLNHTIRASEARLDLQKAKQEPRKTRLQMQYQIQVKVVQVLNEIESKYKHKIFSKLFGVPQRNQSQAQPHQQNRNQIVRVLSSGHFQNYGYVIMEYAGIVLSQFVSLLNRRFYQHNGQYFHKQSTSKKSKQEQTQYKNHRQILRVLIAQLVLILHMLHSNHIIHRDLKFQNILVDKTYTLKLIDFGTVQLQPHSNKYCQRENGDLWTRIGQLDDQLNGKGNYLVGSKHYISPQLVGGKSTRVISCKMDIWALGILVYFILTHKYPFQQGNQSNSQYYAKIRQKQPEYPPFLLEQQVEILTKCLDKNPYKRPSIEQLIKFKYFQGICWRDVEQGKYFQQVDRYLNPDSYVCAVLAQFEGAICSHTKQDGTKHDSGQNLQEQEYQQLVEQKDKHINQFIVPVIQPNQYDSQMNSNTDYIQPVKNNQILPQICKKKQSNRDKYKKIRIKIVQDQRSDRFIYIIPNKDKDNQGVDKTLTNKEIKIEKQSLRNLQTSMDMLLGSHVPEHYRDKSQSKMLFRLSEINVQKINRNTIKLIYKKQTQNKEMLIRLNQQIIKESELNIESKKGTLQVVDQFIEKLMILNSKFT